MSPPQYQVTKSDGQSEHGQRADQHHDAPRDNLHGSSSIAPRTRDLAEQRGWEMYNDLFATD